MLARLVAFAVRVPALVLIAALVLFGAGVFAVSDLNVEAYPNPVPPMVEVARFNFTNGWPSKISTDQLSVDSNDPVKETITLTIESLARIK